MSDDTSAARHLVLVGLMGVGKSTVGAVCAQRLGRAFVDTDQVVETTAGMTVADAFTSMGEDAFRALERRAVSDVSESPEPLVIGCGGGAVVDAGNRAALRRRGFVVWLQAPAEILAARVGDGASRPLLAGGGTIVTLERLALAREAAYAAAADATVDASGTVADVAARVLAAFAEAGS